MFENDIPQIFETPYVEWQDKAHGRRFSRIAAFAACLTLTGVLIAPEAHNENPCTPGQIETQTILDEAKLYSVLFSSDVDPADHSPAYLRVLGDQVLEETCA